MIYKAVVGHFSSANIAWGTVCRPAVRSDSADGIDYQGRQGLVLSCGGKLANGIDEADPVDVNVLTLGSLPHHYSQEAHGQKHHNYTYFRPILYSVVQHIDLTKPPS
jgi:hypothetical protein